MSKPVSIPTPLSSSSMVQPLLPTVPSSKKKKHPSAKRLDAAEPDWAPKMDFSKVSDRILKKYKRTYSIKIKAKETPEELVGSVTKHFHSQVVSERDVLPYFLYCIHNQGKLLKLPSKTLQSVAQPAEQ